MQYSIGRSICFVSKYLTRDLLQCFLPNTMLFNLLFKNNYRGEPITKPVIIQDYNNFMGAVDNSDNLLCHYLSLKSLKWYCKLLLHLVNMYILNKKYGVKKMTHSSYREYIARYLLTTSLEMANCTKKKIPVPIDNTPLQLSSRHFITKFDSVPGSKRKYPA